MKDLAENHRAERRLRTQCERAMRILSSSTQEEIDSLFDGTVFLLSSSEHGLLPQLQGSR